MNQEIHDLHFRRRRLLAAKIDVREHLDAVEGELISVTLRLAELERAHIDAEVNLMRARAM